MIYIFWFKLDPKNRKFDLALCDKIITQHAAIIKNHIS
ncbi:hypothetical protein BB050_02697 [Flavobacterium anhuiense]|uniref:Uncharacterized protein n=1 Tax=Flavobacterium anhuiense TaxID=459526 RepID=A0AAC9D5G3_9FLAO|nr:hypothetical protein BB050_02697 [Flavobacterium anhuiense]